MLVETPKRKRSAHNADPAIISDHAFEPRDQWWSLCKHCGLAQAAHSETSIDTLEEMRQSTSHIGYYSDDTPEVFD